MAKLCPVVESAVIEYHSNCEKHSGLVYDFILQFQTGLGEKYHKSDYCVQY